MKQSKRKNNFRPETHFLFMDDNYWESWASGQNNANCGHHIFGRGHQEGCEKSPFNYAPLNNMLEHLPRHGYWTTSEGKKFLLEKTIKFLERIRYTLTPEDLQFLEKYKHEVHKLGLDI